nr:hypothetical protein [uncultured Trichococcus sp.]
MENSQTKRRRNINIVKIPEVLAVGGERNITCIETMVLRPLLVTKIRDYFAEAEDGKYRQPLEWKDTYVPHGKEEIE